MSRELPYRENSTSGRAASMSPVYRRLEAALEPPSRAGIAGQVATRGLGAGGAQANPAPNPYQALRLVGRYRHGLSGPCAGVVDILDLDQARDGRGVGGLGGRDRSEIRSQVGNWTARQVRRGARPHGDRTVGSPRQRCLDAGVNRRRGRCGAKNQAPHAADSPWADGVQRAVV